MKTAAEIFRDIEAQVYRSSLAQASARVNGAEKSILVHGTTCVATVYRGGVIVAADGRATTDKIETEEFDKVFELDNSSVIAMAGSAGLCQQIASLLKARFGHQWNMSEGKYIPPKTKLHSVANVIRNASAPLMHSGMGVTPILGIYDDDKNDPGGRVFAIFADGTVMPETPFKTIGSGGRDAKNCFDMTVSFQMKIRPDDITSDFLRKNLSYEEAKRFLVFSLMMANRHDQATGLKIKMKNIDKNGTDTVSSGEIEDILCKLRKEGWS